ncbi:hypothetical protein [Pseudophaeobacter sp.]|uniref:hypothetical protein n=1 Tax=Pseudophaeobacter sp. TaxID=1971739 RepID=UPI00329A13B7
MSAWKEPGKKKVFLAKGGKKTKPAIYKAMPHKNAVLKSCGYENTWSGNHRQTLKIKRPEGTYEVKLGVTYKTGQKVKGGKNKPIPESCKLDSAWEFQEIRIFVTGLKMPQTYTCEVDVCFSAIKNSGSPKDFDPWAMFNIDVRTGHMLMGDWNPQVYVCDLFAGKQKVVIK